MSYPYPTPANHKNVINGWSPHQKHVLDQHDNIHRLGRGHRPNREGVAKGQEHLEEQVQERLNHIKEILKPQYDAMAHKVTKKEINEKMYKKLNHMMAYWNDCLTHTKTISEANDCSQSMIERLDNQAIPFALKLAREY